MRLIIFCAIIFYIVIEYNKKNVQALDCGLNEGNDREMVKKIAHGCTRNKNSSNNGSNNYNNRKSYSKYSSDSDDDSEESGDESDEHDEHGDSNKNYGNNNDNKNNRNNNRNHNNNNYGGDSWRSTSNLRSTTSNYFNKLRPRSKRGMGSGYNNYPYSSGNSDSNNRYNSQYPYSNGGYGSTNRQDYNGYNSYGRNNNPYGSNTNYPYSSSDSSTSNKYNYNNNNYNFDHNDNNNYNNDNGTEQCSIVSCILGQLHMTDRHGYPDRGLVAQALTRNIRNMELRNFLQESIEDCFELISDEQKRDSCQYSTQLISCLAEKGRNNCDDWQEQNMTL